MKIILVIASTILSLTYALGQTGYIEVQSEPGLSVYLNGVYKGKTTVEFSGLIIQKVTPGKNTIRVEKEGYAAYEDIITVKADDVFKYVVKKFEKEKVYIEEKDPEFISTKKEEVKKGSLIIQSLPSKIYISIPRIDNGEVKLKSGKMELSPISVGTYEVTFTFNETVITKTFEINPKETTSIFINMLSGEYTTKSINGYTTLMSEGNALIKLEKYKDAIVKFDAALLIRANDKDATTQKNKAQDEVAWNTAFALYNIQSFETYLNGYTIKKHADEAHNNIKSKLIKTGENYANNLDIDNMELYLNKYLSRYPNGADVSRVKQIMCDAYYNKGNSDAQTKSAYSQKNAVTNFEKAAKTCTNKSDIDSKIKTATRLATKYGRPDRFYFAYVHDSNCNIGFSTGTINNENVGMYLTVRFNPTLFGNSNSNGTVGTNGKVTGGQYVNWGNDWRYKGETRTGTFEMLLGITKKISHPLSMYTGIGFSYHSLAWKMEIYDNLGDYHTTDWVKSAESKTYFASEAGLIVDLNGFNLRGGIATNNFKNPRFTFGIGFSIERYN